MEMEKQESMEQPAYTPRPKWQVWLARLGLVAFLLLVALFYYKMFRGGM